MRGAWYDPTDLGQSEQPCVKMVVPTYWRDEGTSKLAQGNSPNTCIVQVEKYRSRTESDGIWPTETVCVA